MNRRTKIIVSVAGIFIVLLALLGLTYAYFLTKINGNSNNKSISVTTADLALDYGEETSSIITKPNIQPGETILTKKFSATNTGTNEVEYIVVFENIENNFTREEDVVYTLECTSSDGTSCNGVSEETIFPLSNKSTIVGNRIASEVTHNYTLTITYKEMDLDQSVDMGKTISAKVNISDPNALNPYASNKKLLAYNIINNAAIKKNGTELRSTPLTVPAQEISKTLKTGKYELRTDFPGWDGVTFGDTQELADSGSNELTGSTDIEKCNNAKGYYISDGYWYYSGESYGYVKDCDSTGKPYLEIKESEKTLNITQDDLGTSYYYRGMPEDNYVNLANKCWRIVRIEGDGSIKLVLESTSTCSEGMTRDFSIGKGNWGYTLAKIINSNGEEKTWAQYLGDYLNGQTDPTGSMKYKLDSWLAASGINTDLLKNDEWCLNTTEKLYDYSDPHTLLSSTRNDLAYDVKRFYYETGKRLYGRREKKDATLKCNGEKFNSYIATLTADEVAYAGGMTESENKYYYLVRPDYIWWWTLSLAHFDDGTGDIAFVVSPHGFLNGLIGSLNQVYNSDKHIRPAISIKTGVNITGGDGTVSNPYTIE